jgi:hypothetical protein
VGCVTSVSGVESSPVVSSDRMINELQRVWQEAVMTSFEVRLLPRRFLEVLRKTVRNFGQVSLFHDQESNLIPSEHKSEGYHLNTLSPL